MSEGQDVQNSNWWKTNQGAGLIAVGFFSLILGYIFFYTDYDRVLRDGFLLGFFPILACCLCIGFSAIMMFDGLRNNTEASLAALDFKFCAFVIGVIAWSGLFFWALVNAGFVVTRDQYRYQLQGIDNAVTVGVPNPATQSLLARRVEEDGVINVVVHDKELNKDIVTPVSQIKVVNFLSPQYLRRVGNGFYSNGRAGQDLAGISGNNVPATGSNGKLKQYALELSNVDLTNEFATMISHQRSFQAGSRVVTTSDAILSEAVNLKR